MDQSHTQSKNVFHFKQFEVDQRDCAMRINTDGVLLGAMSDMPDSTLKSVGPLRILDIGTGTGVVALMLAQRFPAAVVDALEIDPEAAARATSNFQNSPFSDRLQAYSISMQDFQPEPLVGKYDLIVSNPPFFLDALANPDPRKQLARHTDFSFFEILLQRSADWLRPGGFLQLILPLDMALLVEEKAITDYGFVSLSKSEIYSFNENEKPVRILLGLKKLINRSEFSQINLDRFVIYQDRGVYSDQYTLLLKDFFLAF